MKKLSVLFVSVLALGMSFVSCTKDNDFSETDSLAKKEIAVFDFPSYLIMENKVEEVILLKEKKEKIVLDNFKRENTLKKEFSKKTNNLSLTQNEDTIFKYLKKFHSEKLESIYELRKELNFTSIQSIADEINSLDLINPTEAKSLFDKHKKFLIKKEFGIETIFEDRYSNIINVNGEVIVKDKKINLKKTILTNLTGKYIENQNEKSGIVGTSLDGKYVIWYNVGREAHTNSLGIRFYKYYTSLISYYKIPRKVGFITIPTTPVPSVFNVIPSSYAHFEKDGVGVGVENFSLSFPSGYGVGLSNVGGDVYTGYSTADGNIAGTFSSTIGGVPMEITCGVAYK